MFFSQSSDTKLSYMAAIVIYLDRRLTAISIIDATCLQHLFVNVAVVLMVYLRCFCGWCQFCFVLRKVFTLRGALHVCLSFFVFILAGGFYKR